ncbi:MAG: recombinase family protein, partial [Chloroflexi bacterium]|nr:recombinase family protein [Chloroflexota bacterium]
LNAKGVPAPGATWNRKQRKCNGWSRSAIYGDQKRGFGILLNPLYRGQIVWNRPRRLIHPGTKARKHMPRPESEWIVTEAPELRIVPDELWRRVQARLAETRNKSDAIREGIARSGRAPRLPLAEAKAKGLVETFDPRPEYMAHVSELVELGSLRAAGLRVVVDSMHGAGAGYLRRLLAGGKTRIWEVRSARNPAFPGMHNPEPIPRNLSPLRRAVRRHRAQVGLATDGDADRLGVLDGEGRFVNQLQTFALLTYYLLEVRGLRGPIIKSLTTTGMVPRLGELYGVPVHETAVGFKHLGPKMRETDAIIAGEESGGYAFRGHLPERDGILSGLYFLDLMARRRKGAADLVAELFDKVGPHYYDRVDIEMSPQERTRMESRLEGLRPKSIAGMKVTAIDRTDGLRFRLDDGAWALIRLSGTEPLMRIYTEVPREELVAKVLSEVRELTGV